MLNVMEYGVTDYRKLSVLKLKVSIEVLLIKLGRPKKPKVGQNKIGRIKKGNSFLINPVGGTDSQPFSAMD